MQAISYETINSDETQQIAAELALTIKSGDVLCLYGQLGSGKTTFIQGFAKKLGITSKILSPTFILMRSYHMVDIEFYHVDLYRLSQEKEVKELGLEDLIGNESAIVAIEWPEKMGNMLPKKRIDITFEYLSENKRKIEIKRYD